MAGVLFTIDGYIPQVKAVLLEPPGVHVVIDSFAIVCEVS